MPWVLTRGERRRRNRLQGGRLHLGTVADIKSERWPTSSRNRWPACVGIRRLVHRSLGADRIHCHRSDHRVAPPVFVRRAHGTVRFGNMCAEQRITLPCRIIEPTGRKRADPCQASVSISGGEEAKSAPRANALLSSATSCRASFMCCVLDLTSLIVSPWN